MTGAHGIFDPVAVAAACRRDRLLPLAQEDLPRFGERGYWRAGAQQLMKVVAGWWVGEAALFADALQLAVAWLDAPESRGHPWGDNAQAHAARHLHARALAHLMSGRNRPPLWEAAASAHDRALEAAGPARVAMLASGAAVCGLMAGRPPGGLPTPAPEDEDGTVIADILARDGDPARIGRQLYARRHALFSERPGLTLTTLFAALFLHRGGVEPLTTALSAGYVVCPELTLPPAMIASGWEDRAEAILTLERQDFARVDRLLGLLGLTRDGETATHDAPPGFASWTRQPDHSLEVDWRAAEDAPPHLEIRGPAAGRLARFFAQGIGGAVRPGPEQALADLLTVPRRATVANPSAAQARWEMLCAAVAGEGVFGDPAGRALVTAGLADSDWRVRMVALWAVGHHRVQGLAARAEAAALPKPGFRGLSQDDRRVLLALRDLAASRSAGRDDIARPGANAGFVARIAALIDAVPDTAQSRADALIRALLRKPLAPGQTPAPSAWKRWMAAS
ncbi:hypothetical protein D6850_08385 [Roseovarius spongiae]|uniref:Uncharacterized protein n=1 Tax=Roseovarius spongiae TaxID=2320272 RepID=A0A3A8ATH5_9RHOB|nr:hypothetical protein [Roseovarius spongiae]RKF14879.1 hypothetical protein D6850_08385 [Roseovarius spongiae]